MALLKSQFASGQKNVPEPYGSEVQAVCDVIAVTTSLAANDILHFFDLPVDAVPVDVILWSDDLDSNGTPTITLSVGVLANDASDIDTDAENGGAAWIATSTIAQSAGVARPTTTALFKAVARKATASGSTPTKGQLTKIGVKVVAAAATKVAGNIGLCLQYRSKYASA